MNSPHTLSCGPASRSTRITRRPARASRLDRLYEQFAAGRPGMVLTGNVMVDRRHLERARNVVVDGAQNQPGMAGW